MVQVDPTIDPHRSEWSFGNINKYHYRTDGWRDVVSSSDIQQVCDICLTCLTIRFTIHLLNSSILLI